MAVARDRARRNRPWISTHLIHNALLNNHFLDVLQVHGKDMGLVSDDALPGYDPAGVFAIRMRNLSVEFRRQVTGAFARRVGFENVVCVSKKTPRGDAEQERMATCVAMERGVKLIVGGVVADVERRVFARIPMLMRADVVNEILDVVVEGDGLDKLYVAVGVKRRDLMTKDGVVGKRCLERVQSEMWLWNWLLKGVQGRDLGMTLLVGLNPKRTGAIALGALVREGASDLKGGKRAQVFDVDTWNLGVVLLEDEETAVAKMALEGLAWRMSVVDEGKRWMEDALKENGDVCVNGVVALAKTTRDVRLRPNMKCASMYDWPWAYAKREVARAVFELTQISGISQSVTSVSMENGIPNDYRDPRVTGKALSIRSQFTNNILEMCKPEYEGSVVTPPVLPNNRANWRQLRDFDAKDVHKFDKNGERLLLGDHRSFYVDVELASQDNLYSSFLASVETDTDNGHPETYFDETPSLPIHKDPRSQTLMFMIGCGQLIDGKWSHKVFTAKSLSKESESAILREWLEHMHSAVPENSGQPILFVWGPEKQLLRQGLRRMTAEDFEAIKDIKDFKVVDMLQVVTQGVLTIKGSFSNSLKAVSEALEAHGLLREYEQRGGDGSVNNGCDAMALALDAEEHMYRNGLGCLADAPKMQKVGIYNEADCREIAVITRYLREHH